ncbi:MAG: type I-E CRISPR-associated protein Cas6/Cse3/CasE [Kineosporiaceae bacterium]|nr:type I-E CRISPR-associated protein Cas6/Cse3/CasE [Kineosporiaceae bacterium]
MYLSRCEINPRRRGARPLLASPHALHAAVRFAFPRTELDSAPGRVLWRLDSADHRHVLYTVSPQPPDFTHVVEQAGWPATTGWQTRDYMPLLNRLAEGQAWHFRLTANPTHSGRRRPGASTQRFGHVTVEQQATWLVSRSPGWGFAIPEAKDSAPMSLVHQRAVRTFQRKEARVTVTTVVFEGTLEVTDPQLLRQALIGGMGHAKAYGCGLMTLAPITPP